MIHSGMRPFVSSMQLPSPSQFIWPNKNTKQIRTLSSHSLISLSLSLHHWRLLHGHNDKAACPSPLLLASCLSCLRDREMMLSAMNCVKIAILVTLIPLALRGASLLGNDVVVVTSPEQQQQQPPGSKNGASSSPALQTAEHWRWRQHRKDQSRLTAFTRRRFGTGGGGGGGGFFSDEKRFSPTGSNPLHNL
ncbi:hypothetical protein ABZP36_014006 [Zizania latifolia]